MKRKLGMIFFVALLPCLAFAQELQGGGGIQIGTFGYNQDEIDTSRIFWGAHGRLRVMKYLAGEVSVQRRTDDFSINQGRIELETTPVQLSAMVYPLAMLPVTPYLLGGYGWYFLNVNITGDLGLPYVSGEGTLSHTAKAPHIGVGVEAFVGDHVSVGADIRKVFLEFNTALINYKVDAYFANITATFYF